MSLGRICSVMALWNGDKKRGRRKKKLGRENEGGEKKKGEKERLNGQGEKEQETRRTKKGGRRRKKKEKKKRGEKGERKRPKEEKGKGKPTSDLSLLMPEGRLISRRIQMSTEGNLPSQIRNLGLHL